MTHFFCLSRVNLRIADQGLAAGSSNDSNVTSDMHLPFIPPDLQSSGCAIVRRRNRGSIVDISLCEPNVNNLFHSWVREHIREQE